MERIKTIASVLFIFGLFFTYGCSNLALPSYDDFSQTPSNTSGQQLPQITNLNEDWDFANGILEIGVAAAGIFGGAYGLRIARALKTTHDKSKALQEIIAGNEIFKAQNNSIKESFKSAHQSHSPQTRRIISQIKNY